MDAKALVQGILEKAHAGVALNGREPWDIRVKDERLYRRVLGGGSLALGESYMDGWWDSDDLSESIARILRANIEEKFGIDFETALYIAAAYILNLQNFSRARRIAEAHYDLGNTLYEGMLGPSMAYSCACWEGVQTLEEAQRAKHELVCRKLGLKNGDRILDIGCGFGSFAEFAARNYGAAVVGLSISKKQTVYARERTRGLPIEIRLEDYRVHEGIYDHVVALEMFEAVGCRNYRTFMKKAHSHLKDGGRMFLQTAAGNRSTFRGDPWFNKYIFPNGMLPSVPQIKKSADGLFAMEEQVDAAADYDKTLRAWFENFERAWSGLSDEYGGERFRRMWKYYLLASAGSFRSGYNHLWQIVFLKNAHGAPVPEAAISGV